MIDFLAELYVVQLAKWMLFFENPTDCPWILSFQFWTVLLASIWFIRTGVQTSRVQSLVRRLDAEPVSEPRLERAARRARRKLRRLARWSWQRSLRARVLAATRLHLPPSETLLLCNTGWVSSRVLVSRSAVRLLDDEELEAAVAHEYAHVLHRDNLVRTLVEAFAFLVPPLFWYALTLRMVVGSLGEYLIALLAGLGLGAVVRFAVLPLLAYAQERRSDETAGRVIGDRLVVASALVKIGRAAEAAKRPLRLSPIWSPFALFHSHVSQRARGLLIGSGRLVLVLDRWMARSAKLGAVVLLVAAAIAVYRAGERELSARVTIVPGHADVELLEGASSPVHSPPPSGSAATGFALERARSAWSSLLALRGLETCIRGERCLDFGNDFDASTPEACGLSAVCRERSGCSGDGFTGCSSFAVAMDLEGDRTRR